MQHQQQPNTAVAGNMDVVEDLKKRLGAAEARERDLHQHLLFHMQEKAGLAKQVAELQIVCDQLLRPQHAVDRTPYKAQLNYVVEVDDPRTKTWNGASSTAYAAGDALESGKGGGVSMLSPPPLAAPPLAGVTAPRNVGGRETAAAVAAAAAGGDGEGGAAFAGASRGGHPQKVDAPINGDNVWTAGGKPHAAEADLGGVEGPASGAVAESGPARDIPQLLAERGGHIRITELWEAYQGRFGVTRYTLKDLFAMVRAGEIPSVVHEPPAGIRLVPVPRAHRQRRQQVEAGLEEPTSTRLQSSTPLGAGASRDGDYAFSLTSPATAMQTSDSLENGPGAPVRSPRAAETDLSAASGGADLPVSFPQDGRARRSDGGNNGDATEPRSDDSGGWPVVGDTSSAWPVAEATPAAADSAEDAVGRADGKAWGRSDEGGAGGIVAKPKMQTDWKKITREVNQLLIGGELAASELNERYMQAHHKSPFLDGFSMRYAVGAGWIKGVCCDARNCKYNLVSRVPENMREGHQSDPRRFPPRPDRSSFVSRRGLEQDTAADPVEVNWKKISREFRSLLKAGPLEPQELNNLYVQTLKKQLVMGEGYTMRLALEDHLLEGITVDRNTRRLKLIR